MDCLLNTFKPVALLLFWTGFYALNPGGCPQCKRLTCTCCGCLSYALPVVNGTLSFLVFIYTAYIMHMTKLYMGMWHAETVVMIIGGLKPLQCFINFITVAANSRKQTIMWRQLDQTNSLFSRSFDIRIKAARYITPLIAATLTVTVGVLAMRLIDYWAAGQYEVASMNAQHKYTFYVSFVLVIFLNVWLLLPLFYFHCVTKLLRFWATQLSKRLRQRTRTAMFYDQSWDLGKYYECFNSLTESTKAVDSVFNLFVLLSTLRCVTVLCLTLYFFTEIRVEMFEHFDDEVGRHRVQLNMIWGVIDVLVAVAFLAFISWDGAETNRAARQILDRVLGVETHGSDERYQVFLFAQKTNSQYAWGISAWRAFPIERSYALTLCSAIMTYFILIWKLRSAAMQKTACNSCCGHLNLISNSTNITGLL